MCWFCQGLLGIALSGCLAWSGELLELQEAASPQLISCEQAINLAIESNQKKAISRYALQMAAAQHRQVLSSYWPQINAYSAFLLEDSKHNLDVPATHIDVFGTALEVPEQTIDLMDNKTWQNSVELTYPLFTGGKRSALEQQARIGVQAAQQDVRRTDLEVIYDVKRYYWGLVLAQKLVRIAQDTSDRMEITLMLTENLYREGSGTVKKTDFLRNKVALEGIRAILAQLKANRDIARAALVNALGLGWQHQLDPVDTDLPFTPVTLDLPQLIGSAYVFSPDWSKVKLSIAAARAQLKEAHSGRRPKVMLKGSLERITNSLNSGLDTDNNNSRAALGIGIELPIFNGFKTENEIQYALARLTQAQHQQLYLKEALALQIQALFFHLVGAQNQSVAAREASVAADQNQDLHERAYRDELVETKDVIQTQLIAAFMQAQYHKALYDHIKYRSELDFVIGSDILEQILPATSQP